MEVVSTIKTVFGFGVLCVFVLQVANAEQQPTSQYEDVRCKCVCPATQDKTEQPNVYIQVLMEPSECTCEHVVKPTKPNYCDECQCEWQRRNTTTIKVVVIIIILVLSLLVLYMLFLLCLDPLMSRRPKTYLEQHNEEVNLDTQSVTQRIVEGPSTRARRGPIISRVQHQVNRAKGEQERWKGTVQEQRRNVYDRHTMLN